MTKLAQGLHRIHEADGIAGSLAQQHAQGRSRQWTTQAVACKYIRAHVGMTAIGMRRGLLRLLLGPSAHQVKLKPLGLVAASGSGGSVVD